MDFTEMKIEQHANAKRTALLSLCVNLALFGFIWIGVSPDTPVFTRMLAGFILILITIPNILAARVVTTEMIDQDVARLLESKEGAVVQYQNGFTIGRMTCSDKSDVVTVYHNCGKLVYIRFRTEKGHFRVVVDRKLASELNDSLLNRPNPMIKTISKDEFDSALFKASK